MIRSIRVDLQYVFQIDIICSKINVVKTINLYSKFAVKIRVIILLNLLTGNFFEV